MARYSFFWNMLAKTYAKSPVSDEAAYQKKLKITRDYMKPDMEVLEFGCGPGTTSISHASHVKHIQAIDFSPKMLNIARARADAANVGNVTFQVADIGDFDKPDESYDMVMGHSILHLVSDRDVVIARVFALLKPGGVFISSTVCLAGKAGIMRYIMPVGRAFGVLPMLRLFTPDQLLSSLKNAGFTIDQEWLPGSGGSLFAVAKKPG